MTVDLSMVGDPLDSHNNEFYVGMQYVAVALKSINDHIMAALG